MASLLCFLMQYSFIYCVMECYVKENNMQKFCDRPIYSHSLCFCFIIHVHINSFCIDTWSPILQVFKLSQWSSLARCSSGMLYNTTGWIVPIIVGHYGSPIFKGWMSSEEYHKRWLVQRYLLDTHPPTSTSIWMLYHITILPADMLCSSPWYVGPEPSVMGRAKWCAGVKMIGTARSRFDGCLNPPVRTTKPSEKTTSVAFHLMSRQMTASSAGSCPGGT